MWNLLSGLVGGAYMLGLGLLKKDPKKEELRVLTAELEGQARNVIHWSALERCAKTLAVREGASELTQSERDILLYEALREASESEIVATSARMKLLEAEIESDEAAARAARKSEDRLVIESRDKQLAESQREVSALTSALEVAHKSVDNMVREHELLARELARRVDENVALVHLSHPRKKGGK